MSTGKAATIRTERVTKELVETHRSTIIDMLNKSFYPLESVCMSVGVSKNPEGQAQLNLLAENVLLDGVSVIARRVDDNKIVGVAVNKIQEKTRPGETSYFGNFTSQHVTNETAKFVIVFMNEADSQVDLFAELGSDRLLEVMFLVVPPECAGAGIGKALVAASEEVALQEGVTAVMMNATATGSQTIGKARGFRVFSTLRHSSVSFNGVPIAEGLSEHQQITQTVGKRLK